MDTKNHPAKSDKPEELACPLSVVINGETALERLRQLAGQMQETIAQLLAE